MNAYFVKELRLLFLIVLFSCMSIKGVVAQTPSDLLNPKNWIDQECNGKNCSHQDKSGYNSNQMQSSQSQQNGPHYPSPTIDRNIPVVWAIVDFTFLLGSVVLLFAYRSGRIPYISYDFPRYLEIFRNSSGIHLLISFVLMAAGLPVLVPEFNANPFVWYVISFVVVTAQTTTMVRRR